MCIRDSVQARCRGIGNDRLGLGTVMARDGVGAHQQRAHHVGFLPGDGLLQIMEQFLPRPLLLLKPAVRVRDDGCQPLFEFSLHPGEGGDLVTDPGDDDHGSHQTGVVQLAQQGLGPRLRGRNLHRPARTPGRGGAGAAGTHDLLHRRRRQPALGHLALIEGEPFDGPCERLGTDPHPAAGAFAVQTDPVNIPAPDQGVAIHRHGHPQDRLHAVLVPHGHHRLVQVHAQSTRLEADVEDRSDCRAVGPGEVEVGLLPTGAEPGPGGGLHIEVIGARHASETAAAQVGMTVGAGVVREVADAVGVELGGQEQPPRARGRQPRHGEATRVGRATPAGAGTTTVPA